MIDIKGRYAFVTGSSRGVGQQVALGLANLGCHVIVHGRKQGNCYNTIEMLKNYPMETYEVYGDLSEEREVKKIVTEVLAFDFDIDILYNNAALATAFHQNYLEHSWEEWSLTFKVNVFALYTITAAFLPIMIKNGFGRIVNLSSGIKDQPELAPYGASKWAVNKITDDFASKLPETGVRINMLDPGWLQTDMGGENADHPVTAVLPGALAPVLIENDGPNAILFSGVNPDLS